MKTFLGFRGSSSIGPAVDGAVFYEKKCFFMVLQWKLTL